MECSDKYLKEVFEKYDQNKNGSIEPNEFEALVNDLYSKNEIKFLYEKFCSTPDPEAKSSDRVMSISEFQNFLKKENHEKLTEKQVQKLVSKSEKQKHISFIEFSYFIFSEANLIVDTDKMGTVYQDMTRPLNEYFIFSSHNTYALGHQLKGEASPEAYKRAVEKGCRCFELDCWDGPKEPMITHGYTIMSKCTFRECVAAIMMNGFAFTKYPMILTLEMHCKATGQAMIADILKEEIGDKIYVVEPGFENQDELPSPKALLNKVIIRSGSGDALKLINRATKGGNDSENENESPEELDKLAVPRKIETFDLEAALTEVNFEENQDLNHKDENVKSLLTVFSKPLRGKPLHLYDVVNMQEEYDEGDNIGEGTGTFDYLSKTDRFGLQNVQSENRNTDRGAVANNDKKNMEVIAEKEEEKASNDEVVSKEPENEEEVVELSESKVLQAEQEREEDELAELNLNETMPKFTFKKFDPSVLEADSNQKTTPGTPKKGKKHKKKSITEGLNQLLSLFGYNIATNVKMNLIWNVSSISETNFLKFIQKKQSSMVSFTKEFLVRIYPKGTRFDSSNFDPIPGFNLGAQMIALNLQTQDINHAFLTGRFLDNGGCGFVLKPKYLRKGFEDFNQKEAPATKDQIRYRFELISGQQLGEMTPNVENFGVMDPYVKFSMRGAEYDEQLNQKRHFRSKVVDNNGFHPVWKTEKPRENCTEFELCYPELGLFIVEVIDKGESLIGRSVIPFTMLRPGYRVIPLYSKNSLLATVKNTFILVHLAIDNLGT